MAQTTPEVYARRAFEFYEKIANLHKPDEIRDAILSAVKHFGFDYITCARVPSPGQRPEDCVLMNNRPADYVRHYIENNYTASDPVVTELWRDVHTYSWCDVRQTRNLTKYEIAIMDEARDFCVRDGFVVPVLTYDGALSIFSPCGENPDLSDGARRTIEMIAAAGFMALQRAVVSERRTAAQKERLTTREREVAQWLVIGKSDYEAGQILNISEGTVRKHAENIMRKLNVARRSMIAIEALRRGEISI